MWLLSSSLAQPLSEVTKFEPGKNAEEIRQKATEYELDKSLVKDASKAFKDFLNKTLRRGHESRSEMIDVE